MLKEMTTMSKAMRDTNRQYAKSIGALLTPEQQAKLDMEIKKKSFPRVYKESYPSRAIVEAMKFNDLDASQAGDLAALKASYERDLAEVNKKWAAAIEEREEKQGGKLGSMMAGFGGNKDSSDAVGESRKSRKELDTRAKDKLGTILKEDQKKRLPEDKPDAKEDMMGGFFDMEPPEQDED